MTQEEIDRNEELADEVEDRDEAIYDFNQDFAEIDEEVFGKIDKFKDFAIRMVNLAKLQGEFAQLTMKAINELDEKNEILRKQVDILHKEIELLQKELDQLKGQGKQQ